MKRALSFLTILSVIFLQISFTVFANETAVKTDTPEELQQLYAQSAVLMDADSGRILFEKNGMEQRPMASTTKIMTCILALELADLDSVVEISEYASAQPKVRLGMHKGQKFFLRDLLYSLMLESHNDTAVAIAEHISGNVELFAEVMNRKAKEIGLEHTHFVTPNGLDGEDEHGIHSTTAADLASLMRYCIRVSSKKDMFLEITSQLDHTFSDLEKKNTYYCQNHNAFLGMMEGAVSGKTGFTSKAGYCYVGALDDNNRSFIVSLLGCGWPNHKNYKWIDTKKLMQYGLRYYEYTDIWKDVPDLEVEVKNGVKEDSDIFEKVFVSVRDTFAEKSYDVLLSDKDLVKIVDEKDSILQAPLRKGTIVGKRIFMVNESTMLEVPLVTLETVYEKNYRWILEKLTEFYMLKNIN